MQHSRTVLIFIPIQPSRVGVFFVQASVRLRAIWRLIQLVNLDEVVDAWLVDKERGDDRVKQTEQTRSPQI